MIKNIMVYRIDEQDQILYQHFKKQRSILLSNKTRKLINVLPNLLENSQYNSHTISSSNYLDTTNIRFYRSLNEEKSEQEYLKQGHLEQEHLEQKHLEQEHLE